jgi:hypothetical protein
MCVGVKGKFTLCFIHFSTQTFAHSDSNETSGVKHAAHTSAEMSSSYVPAASMQALVVSVNTLTMPHDEIGLKPESVGFAR